MKRAALAVTVLLAAAAPASAAPPIERTAASAVDTIVDAATVPVGSAHVARCGPRGHVCYFVIVTGTGVRCVGRLHDRRGLTAFRCSDEATIPAFAAGVREYLLFARA